MAAVYQLRLDILERTQMRLTRCYYRHQEFTLYGYYRSCVCGPWSTAEPELISLMKFTSFVHIKTRPILHCKLQKHTKIVSVE